MQTFINHLLLKLGEGCRGAILVFRLAGCYREGMGRGVEWSDFKSFSSLFC